MKKITNTGLAILTLALVGFSSNALAAIYQYVNTSGNIRSVEANSSEQAIMTAPNIALHSGVRLYSGSIAYVAPSTNYTGSGLATNQDTGVTNSFTTYQYVNSSGQLQTIRATSAEQAFAMAVNITPRSGVMRVDANQLGA